jgi:uncharacterized protein YjbJ (UPF0337 family)
LGRFGYVGLDQKEDVKMGDKTQRLKGQIKEKAGIAKGDPMLQDKGRRDQVKGNLKKSGEKVKDAAKKL